jgi:protease-4
MKPQIQPNGKGRWMVVATVLFFLMIISFISAAIIGVFVATSESETSGNVAHITISGPIMAESAGGFMSPGVADSTEIVRLIQKADENPEVKAILFEINSPGGTAVASSEIAEAVSKTNKTTVAWIREAGASGAYWVASATDHIVANQMSITGSIGVVASYLEFSGFIHRYNVSYQRLVSGEYKDMGTPFRSLTTEEEKIMQSNLDDLRTIFVEEVAKNRKMKVEDVSNLADGRFFIGKTALKLGLVDELGGKEEAVKWIEKKENITAELAEYKKPKTLAQLLTEVFSDQSYYVGQGIGKSLLDTKVEKGVEIST